MSQFSVQAAGCERGWNEEKSNVWARLWQDDGGALLATEWVLAATLIVIGLVPGLIAIRQSVLAELSDVADATLSLDQSFGFTGQETGCDAGNSNAGLNNLNGASKNTANVQGDQMLNQALRVGTVETRNANGDRVVLADAKNRGGIQAFTGGSMFLDSQHLNGKADTITTRSTPAVAKTKTNRACD
jgi:hypothetical protein